VRFLPPPVADIQVEPEPLFPVEAVTAATDREREVAEQAWRVEHEAWGRRGWASVARLCRWAARNGMKVDCP